LHNILPEEISVGLKERGATTAKEFEGVTVLFTDFVNFTQATEKLSHQTLVQELHECFTAFDHIIERHGLEKIMTVGDAYLAVCGLPMADPRHAQKAVQAALDIRDFIMERKNQGHFFEIRIGIHSGPVVAGIVGVKKFAYDIWGDTVNTAARMEQSGEAGKVNISSTTFHLVKEAFVCMHRGQVMAKNKDALDMYFVEKNIDI
jgi:adenylate cyclase